METVEIPIFLQCLFEFVGTFVMILLGCGVVACTTLKKSKGEGSGWVVITLAWGLAVMCGVLIAGPYTGAHLNPAVTVGLAAAGKFDWGMVIPYIISQVLGAFLGGVAVYYFYKDHFDLTEGGDNKLGVFATIPAVDNAKRNFLSEVIGTFVLILVILFMSEKGNTAEVGLGSIGAIPVALLVVVIGMSLGGTTGYAINPEGERLPCPRRVQSLSPQRMAHHGEGSVFQRRLPRRRIDVSLYLQAFHVVAECRDRGAHLAGALLLRDGLGL